MKSINKNLLFLISFLVILSSCKKERKETIDLKEPTVPKEKLISRETAKSYYNNYTKRYKEISEFTGKKDSRVFWYSYQELEGLIHYFKQESKKKGIKSDGIMFYLGAYPNSNKGGISADFYDDSGYTNLVLVPSQDIDGSHVDVPLEFNANDAEASPPPYYKFGNGGPNNPSLIDGN